MSEGNVTLTALVAHVGYAYAGSASTLAVAKGDSFSTTPERAQRLIAKGIAALGGGDNGAQEPTVEDDEQPVPVKLDGRTKAGKAARHK